MKKVLSVILALMLMMQLMTAFSAVGANSDEVLYLAASHAEGVIGDKVSITLQIKDNNSTGFAGFESKVKFNTAALKLVDAQFSEKVVELGEQNKALLQDVPGGALDFDIISLSPLQKANDTGYINIAILGIINTTENMDIAVLTFEIISETPSTEVIEILDYEASYAINSSFDFVDIPMEVSSGKIVIKEKPLGVTVSGNVTSFNSDTDDVTVALYKDVNAAADYTVTIQGNTANYSIDAVAAGTYTMKVSKKNHVTREYTVTVGETNLTQDAKIHLLGDVNGNGRIQINDINALYKHFRNVDLLDDYAAKCGDVVGTNGRVQINDVNALYKHFRGQDSIWN